MSAQHTLRARVGTVHRGVFDATIAPVLTIASGDVVEITTLSGNPDQMPPPALGFGVLPEHRDVLARVPAGEGPHLLTGPIAVEGAMPRRAHRRGVGHEACAGLGVESLRNRDGRAA
jgi:acetamidase/formamidase